MSINTQQTETVVRHEDVPLNDVPKGALIGAGILLALSILLAAVVRLEGSYAIDPPPAQAVQSRVLIFDDRADRGISVRDGETGALVADLAPGTHGFVRGLLRGLSRDRYVHGVGGEVPFTLTRWSDGRLSITDPATGSVLHLAAYGFANVREFAAFLPPAKEPARSKEVLP